MPTYMYKVQPVRPEMLSEGHTDKESRIIGEHFDYLKQLMDDGILILAGRTLTTDYSSHGIAIFEARDDDHMRDIAQNDPAVIQKQFRAEWYPYRIALHEPNNVKAD
jgi:uncharacterized protein